MKLDPPITLKHTTYKTSQSLISFLDREINFWREFCQENSLRNPDFRHAFSVLSTLRRSLDPIINSEDTDVNEKQGRIRDLFHNLQFQISYKNYIDNQLILSTSNFGKKILEIAKAYSVSTAIDFRHAINNDNFNPSQVAASNIQAVLLAYE